jgi:hypothetical protein
MMYLDVSLHTKIVVGLIGLFFIGYIIYLLYKKKLSESFALGWIFVTIIAISNVLFDSLLKYVVEFTGVKFGALAISLFAFVFIFAMLIIFSIKISTLSIQNKKLAQYVGLLELKMDQIDSKKALNK